MSNTQAVVTALIRFQCLLLLVLWAVLIAGALSWQSFSGPFNVERTAASALDFEGGTVVRISWFGWLVPVVLIFILAASKKLAAVLTSRVTA